jgi:hypothetical protein
MAKIILNRSKGYADKMRAYKIFLDGVEVGGIKEGEAWSAECSIGKHKLALKIDWCKTPDQEFFLTSENDTVKFECGSNLTGWMIPFVTLFLFMPQKWIRIKRTP